ncbi:hypothetical protein J2D78_15425 [Microbacterium maritypicum]|uniref:hypothetical protein n=1 Tax=Microbacterium maritypicum TaxID=33918 RepID=UPI001B319EFC|nr:hypothetical protein [Microbacterium liquefaciens]MBP5803479.1 hypothetical protein [Microbacterium liquefaciens]
MSQTRTSTISAAVSPAPPASPRRACAFWRFFAVVSEFAQLCIDAICFVVNGERTIPFGAEMAMRSASASSRPIFTSWRDTPHRWPPERFL